MSQAGYVPLVEVTRGPIVESIHFGALAVVDAAGRLIASAGDPHMSSYLRSSAKPFQALPFVERGGVEHFGITDRELALMCASHSGTDEHLSVLTGLQKKIGINESDLLCGTHPLSDHTMADALHDRGEQPTPNRHNCSGKHTGMLAHARLRNYPLTNYIDLGHPVQHTIIETFAPMCGLEVGDVIVGIDGCSVPTFAVPLYNAAFGMARLCDPDTLNAKRAAACRQITKAMMANPDMVAGPARFDTEFMTAAKGSMLSKAGAEGYQIIGLLPGAMGAGSPALGIAVKISDGDLYSNIRPTFPPGMGNDSRARALVVLAVLDQLGALSPEMRKTLSRFNERPIRNWRGLEVGELRAKVKLQRG
ncbi:MAG TPA: asparaginase [Longilinea sp.]|nr:asparaginase [Longilinea sp.]